MRSGRTPLHPFTDGAGTELPVGLEPAPGCHGPRERCSGGGGNPGQGILLAGGGHSFYNGGEVLTGDGAIPEETIDHRPTDHHLKEGGVVSGDESGRAEGCEEEGVGGGDGVPGRAAHSVGERGKSLTPSMSMVPKRFMTSSSSTARGPPGGGGVTVSWGGGWKPARGQIDGIAREGVWDRSLANSYKRGGAKALLGMP